MKGPVSNAGIIPGSQWPLPSVNLQHIWSGAWENAELSGEHERLVASGLVTEDT